MSIATGTNLELEPGKAIGDRGWSGRGPAATRVLFVGAAVLAIVLIGFVLAMDGFGRVSSLEGGGPQLRLSLDDMQQVADFNVDDKAQILAEGSEAEKRNDAIPYSSLPVEPVRSFVLSPSAGETYAAALHCLAQAIYYEAATEPAEGRRAVAQVVLNRVRHPAYPDSVCGVVYEGSQRETGCQFSFTCDGALLRKPVARPWHEAEEIAREALAGSVDKAVGTSTNYHADYVLPRWAFRLEKIDRIGRHIFYRLNGGLGRRAMLTQAYSGVEHVPPVNYAMLRQRLMASASQPDGDALASGLAVPPKITDRHAASDVGGRLDVTKTWRLSIPDPVAASANYRAALARDSAAVANPGDSASSSKGATLAVQ